ncbi:hypothetical protein OG828_47385 [Streptomyces sp. NBC_00457]|uniref:hypothetical protein n=1 Tax=Streptomyces sp. NBC_00457 TaxID=2975748 RepID=UPI002E1B5E04
MGGTNGVSVLGAVLARQVQDQMTHGLAAASLPCTGRAVADTRQQPGVVREIVRVTYGDATAQVFLLSATAAVLAVVAALLMLPVRLRSSLDLPEEIVSTPELVLYLPSVS